MKDSLENGSELPLFAGRYRLQGLLGRGSTSAVYRAHDTQAGHVVALKLLDAHLTWDPVSVERLRREVVVSRRITHPGVVQVYDFARDGDRVAVVEELVTGEPLSRILRREGSLTTTRAVTIAGALLEVLAACHQKGVLHRDVKPSNVLVEAEDRIRLTDFGIARVGMMTTVTHTGALLGTPGYHAPEVLRGERPDLRCDLYGVGLVLYEMLTGAPAFDVDVQGFQFGQLDEDTPDPARERPDLPQALSALVRSLLATQPELRPAGAYEAMAALYDLGRFERPEAHEAECPACHHRNRSSIPVCARCGRLRRLTLRRGGWFVRLRSDERTEEYSAHLETLLARSIPRSVLLSRLDSGGRWLLLARGLARESALALVEDARGFAAEVEMGRGLGWLGVGAAPREMVMVLGGGLLSFLGILLWDGKLPVTRLPLTCFVVGSGLVFAFAVQLLVGRRAILTAAPPRQAPRPARTAHLSHKLITRLRGFDGGPLASLWASAVEAYWRAASALPAGAAGAKLVTTLERVLDSAQSVVSHGATLARLLSDRGPAEVARDLERVQARARALPQTDPALTRVETALRDELWALEEADDLIGVAAGRIVLAAGVLTSTARSMRQSVPAPEAALQEYLKHAALDIGVLDHALATVTSKREADQQELPR